MKVPEERVKAGIPGILQMVKAALVFELKGRVGVDKLKRLKKSIPDCLAFNRERAVHVLDHMGIDCFQLTMKVL